MNIPTTDEESEARIRECFNDLGPVAVESALGLFRIYRIDMSMLEAYEKVLLKRLSDNTLKECPDTESVLAERASRGMT